MTNVNIDMELLVQSFSFNEFEFGKEYLDKFTGNILNIPEEVQKVVDGKKSKGELSSWEVELLEDAYTISSQKDRYLEIPTIPDKYAYGIMVSFMDEKVDNEVLRLKLNKALNTSHSSSSFKSVLFEHEDLLGKWHKYEEQMLEQYAREWLLSNGVVASREQME